MSSYYKKIDGKSYDRAMLDIAKKSVEGRGDGRISLADARSIIKQIKDGGRITDIEKRTLSYILEKYKLTETAIKHIEKSLSDELSGDVKETVIDRGAISPVSDRAESTAKGGTAPGGKGKLYIILILLLLAVIAFFVYIKYFYKGNKQVAIPADSAGKVSGDTGAEIKSSRPDDIAGKAGTGDAKVASNTLDQKNTGAGNEKKEKPAVVEKKQAAEGEYLVKDGDSLIKISEALFGDYKKWLVIYKLNKTIIKDPRVLYPGQVLKLPEK